ncbi:MAG: hypothetical protein ABIQ12_09865 [Opitutaceae bacterium]
MIPSSSITFLPPDYSAIKLVGDFEELIATPFGDGVNALCWPRTLPGDFREIVERLAVGEGRKPVERPRLESLDLSVAGRVARDILLDDLRLLRECGLDPSLDCIRQYPRDTEAGPIPTDVYSFHADSALVPADTYLCTYYGAASEGLRNDQARRRVDVPETRAALLSVFGDGEGAAFDDYLEENCFNLHYAPLPGAQPFSFDPGNLWRIACDYPGSPVPPCIHRAPETPPDGPPRLLLIS